jgi:hypothetical protein
VARLSVAVPLEDKPPSRLKGLSQRVRLAMDLQERQFQWQQGQDQGEDHQARRLLIDPGGIAALRAAEADQRFRPVALRRTLRRWAAWTAARRVRALLWRGRRAAWLNNPPQAAPAPAACAAGGTAGAWVDVEVLAMRVGRHGVAALFHKRQVQRFVWGAWVSLVAAAHGCFRGHALGQEQHPEKSAQPPVRGSDVRNEGGDEEEVLLVPLGGL